MPYSDNHVSGTFTIKLNNRFNVLSKPCILPFRVFIKDMGKEGETMFGEQVAR